MKLESLVCALEWQVPLFPFLQFVYSRYERGFIAKKLCPDLMFVPINGPRYSEMSGKVMDIFRRYDPNMCPAGTDEGYLK
jgi:nucleotidyltransferase/DNA polymerase involved in DNA repair